MKTTRILKISACKLLAIIFYPWKKYSEFIDKGSRGIWGLSPILKYTFLYFFLFFIPVLLGLVKLYEDNSTSEMFVTIYVVGLLAIVFVWLIFVPILLGILFFRTIEKVRLFFKKDAKTIYSNVENIYLFWFRQFQTYITAFFPFSEISKGSIFHHRYKEVENLWGFVCFNANKLKVKISALDFEVTKDFVKLVILIKPRKGKEVRKDKLFQKIIERYGENNTYIDNFDEEGEIKLIRVNRHYFLDSK